MTGHISETEKAPEHRRTGYEGDRPGAGPGGQARIHQLSCFRVPCWSGETAAAFPSRGIFISYRRVDAGPYARLLQVRLGEYLPSMPVFMDLDSIEAGVDFAEAITAGLDASCVLVALIGPGWLTATDDGGRRRLDNPDDCVRFEIRAALQRGVRVIPVLVDGARMPGPQQLPADLGKLARLNHLEMSYDRYEYDESRLAAVIWKVLTACSDGTTPLPAPPADQPRRQHPLRRGRPAS